MLRAAQSILRHLSPNAPVLAPFPLPSLPPLPPPSAEDAFVQLCTDFAVVPLLVAEGAAREAFQAAVKAGPMGAALCWVGLVRRCGLRVAAATQTYPKISSASAHLFHCSFFSPPSVWRRVSLLCVEMALHKLQGSECAVRRR